MMMSSRVEPTIQRGKQSNNNVSTEQETKSKRAPLRECVALLQGCVVAARTGI
jgi:hypothetical protein